jgi:hypothetical protein
VAGSPFIGWTKPLLPLHAAILKEAAVEYLQCEWRNVKILPFEET